MGLPNTSERQQPHDGLFGPEHISTIERARWISGFIHQLPKQQALQGVRIRSVENAISTSSNSQHLKDIKS